MAIWRTNENNELDDLYPDSEEDQEIKENIEQFCSKVIIQKTDKHAEALMTKTTTTKPAKRKNLNEALMVAKSPEQIKKIYQERMRNHTGKQFSIFHANDAFYEACYSEIMKNEKSLFDDRLSSNENNTIYNETAAFMRLQSNTNHPCFASGVTIGKIKYEDLNIRGVKCVKKMNIGEKIGAAIPFAAAAITNHPYPYCITCFETVATFIPCSKCANALFCSIRCKFENKTHAFECNSSFHLIEKEDIHIKCCIAMVLQQFAAFENNSIVDIKKLKKKCASLQKIAKKCQKKVTPK